VTLATLTLELDLDNSGAYATDITAYLISPQSFNISNIGRQEDLDVGGMASLTLALDNATGRFSPQNAAGAYYDNLHPGIGIRLTAHFNAVNYTWFTGIVEDITVDPSVEGQRTTLTAQDMGARLAATDIRLTLMENALTGTIINTLLDNTGIGAPIMPRAIDAGDTRIERVTFDRGEALGYIQRMSQEELGGLFYFNAGIATFEAKSHRWLSPHTVSQATFTERGVLSYAENIRDRISEVILEYPQWEIGASVEPVFQLFGAMPRFIPASGTLTVEAPYGGTIVSNSVTPVANTDYIISSFPGGGDDRTGDVTLDFTDYGGASKAVFTETSGVAAYLLTYAVRGTPIRYSSDLTPVRATPSTPPGIPSTVRFGYDFNSLRAAIQTWADYLAARWGDSQRERLTLTLQAPWPEAHLTDSDMVKILSLKVSDRITVVNTTLPFSSAINGDYHIDLIDLVIDGEHIETTYRLVPVDADFFIWDSSSWDGADVLAP